MKQSNGQEREYRFINPDNIETGDIPAAEGTKGQVLADGLLDIIQIALEKGMSDSDVEEAMQIVTDTLAERQRAQFKLHIND